MNDSDCQEGVFALLADPTTHGGAAVTRIDTHAASVFLAGASAFKVKRAVRFPFLDYSTLAKRKVAMQMLDDLKAGVIQGIAAYDFKRLTRDEFGIDGGTIARIVVQAGGRFHTLDREYNLRLDDDLLQFQFQCFIAGIDWRNIRNTFWSGTFKKLEREPHYMKTPLGYMNVADEQGKVVNWKFEGYGIGPLYRNGWKRDVTMKAGDRITVNGSWEKRDTFDAARIEY